MTAWVRNGDQYRWGWTGTAISGDPRVHGCSGVARSDFLLVDLFRAPLGVQAPGP
ncbi:hypothetical protein [Streptomyces sp. NPDC051364]|uniref:hypothetical protein n=1 Tax=Streptomyces sp. NPDC051364 TaxID=3155799 RepID=UPI00343FCF37